jgi:hypothetical protein
MDRAQNPDLKPSVDVHKRTTKVNIGVVIGVTVFLLVMSLAVFKYWRNPDRTANEQHQRIDGPP